jgi:acyl carrier protein
MNNFERLEELILDILLLEPDEYSLELRRDEVETWDSLSVVSIAVGLNETFGYHPTPEEATAIAGVRDIIDLLSRNGIEFGD